MKAVPFFIACLSLLSVSAYSKVGVTIPDHVAGMVDDIRGSRISVHKSGLKLNPKAYKKMKMALGEAEINPDAGIANWRNDNLKAYKVEFDKNLYDKIYAVIGNEFKSKGLGQRALEDSGQIFVIRKSQSLDTMNQISDPKDPDFKFEDRLEDLKVAAEAHISDFDGLVEFENYEITYLNGSQKTVELRYRRIFSGGIVRGNISWIYLRFNRDKSLEQVKIKWPKFTADPTKPTYSYKMKKDINAIKGDVVQFLEDVPGATNDGVQVRQPLGATINGIALAWLTDSENGTLLIKPGYSFQVGISYEDNVSISQYYDALAYFE